MEYIERDFISKRVVSAVSYLQKFFKLKANKKLWCAILQVLNDVQDYFHSLPFYAKVDFIQNPFVSYISKGVPNSCIHSLLDRQEQEWLYLSYSAYCRPNMYYKELLDAFSEHNGYMPNNVMTNDEKLLYFKMLPHLFRVNKYFEVHPYPMADLINHPVLSKDVFKYYNLETFPADTFVEQNIEVVTRPERTIIWCKRNVVYKKLCAIIRFLLHSFGSLSCGHLKKCISYVWADIKVFLDETPVEKHREIFSSIVPTNMKFDDLYLLPSTMTYTLEWDFGSKRKLCATHIVCNLALHGEINYLKLWKDLVSSTLKENSFSFTSDKMKWCRYLIKGSKLWEFTEHKSLKLPSSFHLGSVPSVDGSLNTMKHCSFQQDLENIATSMESIVLHVKNQNTSAMESKKKNLGAEHSSSESSACNKDANLSKNAASSNSTYPAKSEKNALCSNVHSEISISTDKKKENCPYGDLVSKIAGNDYNLSVVSIARDIAVRVPEPSIPKSNAVDVKAVPGTCPSGRDIANSSREVKKTELVYSKNELKQMSQNLQGCIAYLVQFFECNLNSGFFEVVVQVLDYHIIFSKLPHLQQQQVVKGGFNLFHVDPKGRVISDPTKQKPPLIDNITCKDLCVAFIVSQYGEQHYSEVFSKYKACVESKVHLKPPDELDYFQKRKDLFKVSHDGHVSLLTTPSLKWDYTSFIVSNHRRIPSRIFGRIKESAILLGKNFDILSAEQMMRAILYILRDIYPYLITKSDYHKCILKEVCSYYESERNTLLLEEPATDSVTLKSEEKDLLVLACVLVSSGTIKVDKLFHMPHGRSAESMAGRNLRPSFEKKQNYFAVDYLKNVCLKGEIPTALNLGAFFKDMDLKESFQSALFSGPVQPKSYRKFKPTASCIQHNTLCLIHDICLDVLFSKMTRQGQDKETPGCKSKNAGPTFGTIESGGAVLLNGMQFDFNPSKSTCLRKLHRKKNDTLSVAPLPKFAKSPLIQWGNEDPWSSPGTSGGKETKVFRFCASAENANVPSRQISSNVQPFALGQQDTPSSLEANKTDEFKFHVLNSSKLTNTYLKNLQLEPKDSQFLLLSESRLDDAHSRSTNNLVSQISVNGTFTNNLNLGKDIFEEDKSYYNNLIDSFLSM